MKLQDVILRAIAKRISWIEAAEIAGMNARTMVRLRQRYEQFGYDGIYEQRRRKRYIHRVPLGTAEAIFALYQAKYAGMNVWRFCQKLSVEHGIRVSYSWLRQALAGAGLAPNPQKPSPPQPRRKPRHTSLFEKYPLRRA
ncbi:MAG TPA: helix-turn-helix domain-containing protein [Bryobacteraceae bacterium]|nr:helix-turn-helix domain-containing protein [Bryobacteraceae bacterium]